MSEILNKICRCGVGFTTSDDRVTMCTSCYIKEDSMCDWKQSLIDDDVDNSERLCDDDGI